MNNSKSIIPCWQECCECFRQWWKLAEHLKVVVWLQDRQAEEVLLKGLLHLHPHLLQWKWSLQLFFLHRRELLLYGFRPDKWQECTHLQV